MHAEEEGRAEIDYEECARTFTDEAFAPIRENGEELSFKEFSEEVVRRIYTHFCIPCELLVVPSGYQFERVADITDVTDVTAASTG